MENSDNTNANGNGTTAPAWLSQNYPDVAANTEAVGVLARYKTGGEALLSTVAAHKEMRRLQSTPGQLPENFDGLQPSQRTDLSKRMLKLLNLPETYLARPGKPEEYKFQPPADLPEQIKPDAELEGAFRGIVHKHGIPNEAAQEIYALQASALMRIVQKQQEAAIQVSAKAEETISGLMGGEDKMIEGNKLIERAFNHAAEAVNAVLVKTGKQAAIDPAKLKAEIERTNFGNSPELYLLMNHFATRWEKEHSTNPGQGGSGSQGSKSKRQQDMEAFPNSPDLWAKEGT